MMKKFMCLILAVMLCNIPAGVYALEENPDVGIENVLLTEDFEEAYYPPTGGNYVYHTADTSGWSWTLSVSDAENKVKMLHTYDEATDERGSKGLALYDEIQTGKRFSITPPMLSAGAKIIKYEFDVYVPLGSKRSICYINGNNKATTFAVIDGRDNQRMYQLYDSKIQQWSDKASFTPDEWVHVSLIVNLLQGEVHLFENGEMLLSHPLTINTLTEAEKTIKGLHVETSTKLASESGSSATAKGEASLFDNITFSSVTPLIVEGVIPANGATDVPRLNTEIEVNFSREIYYYDAIEVAVTDNEGNNVAINAEFDENNLTISFDEALAKGMTYTVSLGSEEFSFTTADTETIVSKPVITQKANAMFEAQCTVMNDGENACEAELVVAVYDSKNTMVAINTDAKTEILPETEEPFTAAALFADAQSDEEYSAKAFVVDNLTDLNMLRSDFAQESFTYSANTEAQINDDMMVTVNGENMTVALSVSDVGERVILIEAYDPDGSLNHLAPVKTDDDGKLTYVFAPASENNGLWSVRASGRKITDAVSKDVNFVSPATQKKILDAILDANSKKSVAEVFEDEKNVTALNIDKKYFTDNAYLILSEQRKELKDFAAIGEMMITAYNLLESVNSASWSEMSDLIEENEKILMKNTDGYSYYSGLSETKQNVVNKKFKSEYESIEAFREAFSDAVDDYRDSLKSSSGSGGGGGGSRKTSATVAVTKPKVEVTVPEKEVKPEEEKPVTKPEQNDKELFSDLENVQWAKKAIEMLSKKGVISGDGNGEFRPEDSVLREEFVKMLVSVLELDITSSECSFTDIAENAWYTPYLAAAQKAGIVTGNPDGSFGTGKTITRQEMAVMIYRALEAKKIELGKAECDFSDAEAISKYALDAVAALKNAGIISGVGEGEFAPLMTANRAQAATIIFNLFDKGVIK